MNIFILSRDKKKSARMLCNQHIIKMPTESAQMISMAFFGKPTRKSKWNEKKQKWTWKNDFPFLLGKKPDFIMLPTLHYYHPCTVWTRSSYENLIWHAEYGFAMYEEYLRRYPKGKGHKRAVKIYQYALDNAHRLRFPRSGLTEFYQAVPNDVKNKNVVKAYRDFYRYYKSKFAVWQYTEPPKWYGFMGIREL